MDKKLLQNLSAIVSKLPKKDLEKNLEKAKSILKNSKKEDLEKLLSNPKISKTLGLDANTLKDTLANINLENINADEIEENLKNQTRG